MHIYIFCIYIFTPTVDYTACVLQRSFFGKSQVSDENVFIIA